MEFIQVESKCGEDINVRVRCEYYGKTEVIYGKDKDGWYDEIKWIKCPSCRKSTKVMQAIEGGCRS